jgi:hypothetical protein
MKEFFLELLQDLQKLTGIRQFDNLHTDTKQGMEELNELLAILIRTCEMFPLIPKDAQKSILRHAVISDGDFIGLNAKWVYKSLQAQRDRFFKEAAHIPSEVPPDWKPVEGEARQEWLNRWAQSLSGFTEKTETKSHVRLFEESLPPKEKGIVYPSTSAEQVIRTELHIDYLREMQASGLPPEQWILESEWLKGNRC